MRPRTTITQALGPYRTQAGSGKLCTALLCSPAHRNRKRAGVTLIELLCVCLIITILASMLLPAVARAYRRAKAMQEEFEDAVVFEMLLKATRNYCTANPKYRFDSRDEFSEKCGLPSKCKDWIYASRTEFVPFDHVAPTNLVVLTFHYGRRYATSRAFNIAELSIRPDD